MFCYNTILIISFIILTFHITVAYSESEYDIQKCEVFDEDICILYDGQKLSKGEQCVTSEGNLYFGINNSGHCEYVKYLYEYDEYNYNKIRDVNSPNSDGFCNAKIPENCVEDTYYLFRDQEGTILETDNPLSGYLYYCNKENTCTIVHETGYYVDVLGNIYSCNNNESKCNRITAKESCSETSIGELFYDQRDNNKILLCLSYESNIAKSVLLDIHNAGNYIIDYKNGNIFGLNNSKEYAIVKVEKNSVILDKSLNVNLKYIYAGRKNNKILNRGICTDDDGPLMELICNSNAICIENSKEL